MGLAAAARTDEEEEEEDSSAKRGETCWCAHANGRRPEVKADEVARDDAAAANARGIRYFDFLILFLDKR